ncbi:MAG TPA: hypothetical protein VJ952_06695, partial [Opitutales bacterium]|nr:hypothetical protein [Opitutales bacterium]
RLWVLNGAGELIKGYPEAIAMSGDFARVFESESLDWDPSSGSFRAHPTPCLHANVEGEGVAALWTRRALERLGFGVCEDASKSSLSIAIEEDGNWTVTRAGQSVALQSIDAVIDWVLAQDWA